MEPSESALRQYLQVLKRQAWLVILVPVVTLAAIVANLERQDSVYRASTKIAIGEKRGVLPNEFVDESTKRTIADVMRGNTISRRVIDELGLNMSVQKFQKKLKVELLPDVSAMDVGYDSTDRRLALLIVRSLSANFNDVVEDTLGPRAGSGTFDIVLREVDEPYVHPEAVAPKYGTNIIFGAIAGLALGLLLASRVRRSTRASARGRTPSSGSALRSSARSRGR